MGEESYKNTYTILQQVPVEEIKKDDLFVSDGFAFSLEELHDYFKNRGRFVNPYTNEPFSQDDQNKLRVYPWFRELETSNRTQNTLLAAQITQVTLDKISATAKILDSAYQLREYNNPKYADELAAIGKELGFINENSTFKTCEELYSYLNNDRVIIDTLAVAHKTRSFLELQDYLKNNPDELAAINNLPGLRFYYNLNDSANLDDYYNNVVTKLDMKCLNGACGLFNEIHDTIVEIKLKSTNEIILQCQKDITDFTAIFNRLSTLMDNIEKNPGQILNNQEKLTQSIERAEGKLSHITASMETLSQIKASLPPGDKMHSMISDIELLQPITKIRETFTQVKELIDDVKKNYVAPYAVISIEKSLSSNNDPDSIQPTGFFDYGSRDTDPFAAENIPQKMMQALREAEGNWVMFAEKEYNGEISAMVVDRSGNKFSIFNDRIVAETNNEETHNGMLIAMRASGFKLEDFQTNDAGFTKKCNAEKNNETIAEPHPPNPTTRHP